MSASADRAQSGGFFFTASAKLFLTQVKHMSRSSCEKPTLSPTLQSLGNSCIMFSRRVGDLNFVFASSAHLGLTNSGITPPVVSKHRAIPDNLNTKTLMFPGNGEKPVSSATSPPVGVIFNNGSNWLYSTLMVNGSPSPPCNVQMPPMASFGRRGTATEFMTKSFLAETPKMAQRERKGSGFVSWKSRSHSLPSSAHFFGKPFWCSKACTSP
mmetsp:Transcript_49342/g.138766  ORF Transcript_49342/g.138766 Transcript_49342/m.138766 type:complete len:212 (+) Transcript_49342:315-950(+)